MVLIVDNYDSFTWNLVQGFGAVAPSLRVGVDLVVVRNDAVTVGEVEGFRGGRGPERIVVSPGPCGPAEAGVSGALVERFAGRVPVLGVCLGHQVLGACAGMVVGRAQRAVHGKTSVIEHDGRGVFRGIESPTRVMRYHSLVVAPESVPEGWEVSAWATEPDGTRVVMGMRRVWTEAGRAPLEGVQFHPESYMTERGAEMLRNFLGM